VELHHLTTAVETIGGHVVTAMTLTGFAVGGQRGAGQGVVGTAHVALGTGLAVLLYGHGVSPVRRIRLLFGSGSFSSIQCESRSCCFNEASAAKGLLRSRVSSCLCW